MTADIDRVISLATTIKRQSSNAAIVELCELSLALALANKLTSVRPDQSNRPSNRQSNKPDQSNAKSNRFDKRAYQRAYMRQRRAKASLPGSPQA